MQIGEAVAVAAISELDECPFCEAEEDPGDKVWDDPEDGCEDPADGNENAKDYRVQNDSGTLSSSLTGAGRDHPDFIMEDPWAFTADVDEKVYAEAMRTREVPDKLADKIFTYEIKADEWRGHPNGSWVDEHQSRVRCNAHHLIPGNAALWPAKNLLVWFAKTVKRSTTYYYDTDDNPPPVSSVKKRIEAKEGAGVEVEVTRGKTKPRKPTAKPKDKDKVLAAVTGKVKGKVEWELNGPINGAWLPSNNAVAGWSNTNTNDPKFGNRYASQAIRATGPGIYRQFHDAHEKYSESVGEILGDIASEIESRSKVCKNGTCDGSKKGEKSDPLPAPTSLKQSLEKVSRELKLLLMCSPSKWKEPFLTSSRNAGFKIK